MNLIVHCHRLLVIGQIVGISCHIEYNNLAAGLLELIGHDVGTLRYIYGK